MGDWQYAISRLEGNGTEVMLDWDVPFRSVELISVLSGPDSFTGTITPEVARLRASDGQPLIRPWASAVYAILDGVIRNACIVTELRARGEELTVTATGWSGYLQGLPWLKADENFGGRDPMDVVGTMWTYAQSLARGNVGLVLDAQATPKRLPTKPTPRPAGDSRPEEQDDSLTLSYRETQSMGSVMDDLAQSTPIEYRESHSFVGNTPKHRLILRYKAIGRKLDGLRLVVGENILAMPDSIDEGVDYADEVFVMGAGEGSKMLRAVTARSNETRLRRATIVSDQSLTRQSDVDFRARLELEMRRGLPEISEVRLIDHPNARIGSMLPGDVVLIQTGSEGWQGDVAYWVKILSITLRPDDVDLITLSLARIDGV